jgi:hypothetical protein
MTDPQAVSARAPGFSLWISKCPQYGDLKSDKLLPATRGALELGRWFGFRGGSVPATESCIAPGAHRCSVEAMAELELLSTDFDGTLIGFGGDGRCCGAFAEALNEHRRLRGLWAVNTGRNLDFAVEGLARFGGPAAPDFLLTNERDIFRRTSAGTWEAHEEWNTECARRHDELFEVRAEVFREIAKLTGIWDGLEVIEEAGRPAGLVAPSEEIMGEVVGALGELAHSAPEFSYQRNTIYLRFCHIAYHKGSALAELAEMEGISADKIFAAGDHFNDLPMLTGEVATHVACPANAIAEVKEAVRRAGGYVSGYEHGEGVADAIAHVRAKGPGPQMGTASAG